MNSAANLKCFVIEHMAPLTHKIGFDSGNDGAGSSESVRYLDQQIWYIIQTKAVVSCAFGLMLPFSVLSRYSWA
jgi:hypothetical protein